VGWFLHKMNNKILHGLEYELGLMVETNKGLLLVNASAYLKNQYTLLPSCVTFDLNNIEIFTPPRESYKEAVESANYILDKQLIPALINNFKLEKFALFLPTPMCKLFYTEEPIYYTCKGRIYFKGMETKIIQSDEPVTCLKHWNISININGKDSNKWEELIYLPKNENDKILEKYAKNWGYDLISLLKKGYQVTFKEPDDICRVHIKIPYHYTPINGNPDLLPNFEDTLLPPEKGWRNLVCYYKDNNFVKVRDLI